MRVLFLATVLALFVWCALPERAAASSNDAIARGGTDARAAYAQRISAVARSLEAVARGGARHVPPAPLPGPPRYSPSLDDWLQAVLVAARAEKPKTRVRTLRRTAAALRYALVSADLPATEPARPVGATLAAILRNPAYHEAESSEQAKVEKSWWERFIEWLAGMFERLLRGL